MSSGSVRLAILCEVPKRRDSVLPFFKFRSSSLHFSQSAKQSMSFDNLALIDWMSLSATYRTVSSAYFKMLECSITSTASLNNIKNNEGPNQRRKTPHTYKPDLEEGFCQKLRKVLLPKIHFYIVYISVENKSSINTLNH